MVRLVAGQMRTVAAHSVTLRHRCGYKDRITVLVRTQGER